MGLRALPGAACRCVAKHSKAKLMILETVEYLVIGTTPLLMHNPASFGEKRPAKSAGDVDTQAEAEKAVYRNKTTGEFYLPSAAFRQCLFSGTKQKKVGKFSALSFAKATIFTVTPEIVILDPKTMKPATDYKIDLQQGVNQANGARIIIIRPRFDTWAAIVPFRIDTEIVNSKVALEWLKRGGQMAGVGAFRIENGGEFGGFETALHKSEGEKLKKAA